MWVWTPHRGVFTPLWSACLWNKNALVYQWENEICWKTFTSHAPTDFILTDVPKPTLTVRPQSSVFTGDSVTLRCELDQSWDGWEFLWSKDSNTESPEAETKTISSVKVSDGGEYRCRARRGGYNTHYSEPVAVTIHGKCFSSHNELLLKHYMKMIYKTLNKHREQHFSLTWFSVL